MKATGGFKTWKLVLFLALLGLGLIVSQPLPAVGSTPVLAYPQIFASPVHAGCYKVKPDRCKIHVEPFTINIASGTKLVQFRLVTIQARTGTQRVIYDWRPDLSNPAPSIGTTYTPSRVAKDFAASCGQTYQVNLQGQDTGDAGLLSLGLTNQFTCPAGTYTSLLPLVRK